MQESTAGEGEEWALSCGSEVRCRVGFLTNKLMLAELSFALSKHCLCHYNGAWLAFVSITLSKHRFCNDKPSCTSVHHSQQALLLDAHPVLACSCLRLLASIGFGHPKTSCLGVSQYEQALLLYIQKQLARLSVTLCKHRGCNDVACLV